MQLMTDRTAQSLGLIMQHHAKELPSNGVVLLFADKYRDFFPGAIIRLGRFLGMDKSQIINQQDLEMPISKAFRTVSSRLKKE